jgi:endo-1,4-beta-mannosidase
MQNTTENAVLLVMVMHHVSVVGDRKYINANFTPKNERAFIVLRMVSYGNHLFEYHNSPISESFKPLKTHFSVYSKPTLNLAIPVSPPQR